MSFLCSLNLTGKYQPLNFAVSSVVTERIKDGKIYNEDEPVNEIYNRIVEVPLSIGESLRYSRRFFDYEF